MFRLTHDLKEGHVNQFVDYMKKADLKAKTIRTRVMYVSIFLKHIGSPIKIRWTDLPKVPTVPVKAFSPEEVKALMAEADEDERAVFSFFLGTGCREAEVSHAEWSDIDLPTVCTPCRPRRHQTGSLCRRATSPSDYLAR
jgi:integrase